MKTLLSFFMTILFAAKAFPQANSSELTCRAKAKEVAASTYSSCVDEVRQAQVEQIRSNYQKDLAAVKAKYDKELKSLKAGSAAKNTAPGPVTVKEVKKTSKATKGIAKQLPAKQPTQTEATPIQTVTEGEKVVAVGPERSAESLEKDAVESDQVEIIETPVE